MRRSTVKKHQGFSLPEILISVFIIGLISVIASSGMAMNGSIFNATYNQTQNINNQGITKAFMLWSKSDSTLGTLPTPYTGGSYYSSIVNTGSAATVDVDLMTYIQQQGIGLTEANDDNFASHRIRVFQKVSGLTKQMPLYVLSGPLVTLTYDFGVVYQTACRLTDSSCNTSSVHGSSATLTSSNYTSWTTSGTDFGAAYVSTLPLHEAMLNVTIYRLQTIRSKLLDAFNIQKLGVAPGDTTDWFVAPNGTGATNLSGASATTNQGCYDGWYSLNSGTVNVLSQLGLGQSEYGVTAWGGVIQYCRDYDPTYAGVLVQPHYAALRINQSVSTAASPDTSIIGNNVFITF